MKECLAREVLFNYYHQNLDSKDMILVKSHVENCRNCQELLDSTIEDIKLVKYSYQQINPDIEIPEFKIENKVRKFNYRKTLSWAASICLLVAFSTITTVKIIDNQKPVNDYEYFEYIPDMNDAWKANSITVTSYDKNGNPINHQVIKD